MKKKDEAVFVVPKEYLDSEGRFLFGNHKGELAERVALLDYAYVSYLVSNRADICDEDREILSALLTYSEGRKK